MIRKLLVIPLLASCGLFAEAVFSDLLYSNCYGVGSPSMYCLTKAGELYPLVIVQGKWILAAFEINSNPAKPYYYSFSETLGFIAGISFAGIALSLLFVKFDSILRKFRRAFAGTSVAYMMMMFGFIIFYPYCVQVQCRVTNYLPWMSYDVAFAGVLVIFAACFGSYLWEWFS